MFLTLWSLTYKAKASLKKCLVSLITDHSLIYISMRMNRFLIQNYKKIKNSGWIYIDNLTAFVVEKMSQENHQYLKHL